MKVHKHGWSMMKNNTLQHLSDLIRRYPILEVNKEDIKAAVEQFIICYQNDGKLLCCGNGGSAADCEHIVGELMKGFKLPRKLSADLKDKISDDTLSNALQYGLPAISLVSQCALTTAFSNDRMPEAGFAQQVLGYGRKNDVLLCISTSGNSLNCVYAAKVAKAIGMKVISLTGKLESKLSQLSDVTIRVPAVETYQAQELHLPIYHTICLMLENEFYGD